MSTGLKKQIEYHLKILDKIYKNNQIVYSIQDIDSSTLPDITKNLSKFLIKAQWIEYQTKELVILLSLLCNDENLELVRLPPNLEKSGLGELIKRLKEFNLEVKVSLKKLIIMLDKFSEKRNKYTHHIFSSEESLSKMVKELKEVLLFEDEVINELEIFKNEVDNLPTYLKEN